jgi:acylphosphatase
MPTRRYVVRGRVQAVGFREYTRRTATRLGVTGWVRNLADGRTVEAVATADDGVLQTFEEAIRRGPPGSFVAECAAEDYPALQMESFEVRF